MRLALALLFVTVLALTGCRETITGPEGPGPFPIDPTGASATEIYLKGPSTLRVNQIAGYRAEPVLHPDLDHYEWSYYGPGEVNAMPNDPDGRDRVIQAKAVEEGSVLLIVKAFDAEGNRLATGTRELTITTF